MYELTGSVKGVSFDYLTGKPMVTLELNEKQTALDMVDALSGAEKLSLKVDKYRKRRSLDANRYFWLLLGEIANELRRDKEELYLEYIKQYGIFKDFVLTEDEAKTFQSAWSMLGTGWPTEQVDYDADGERLVIRAYYGSSKYNTKQMSRLIESVVEDAQSLGIETKSSEEIESLLNSWKG